MSRRRDTLTGHRFKGLKDKQAGELVADFHALMVRYFPNSVADGVAGMAWCLGTTIRLYIKEGVFSVHALQFFGEAVSQTLPGELK